MSEVDNLAFVIDDGILSEAWSIVRSKGEFAVGGWKIVNRTTVPGWGVVSVASPEDLEMLPEADRVTGIMVFHSQERIFETQKDSQPYGTGTVGQDLQHFSDIMTWNFQPWRIIKVWPYSNRNYWKAFGVRMQGN